jgi:BRCT domain type II-containing protein
MHCNAWSEKCFDTPACTKFEGGISISESIHKTNQTGHTSFGSSSFGAASTLDSAFGALRWWLWEILYGEYGEYV